MKVYHLTYFSLSVMNGKLSKRQRPGSYIKRPVCATLLLLIF